jgi:hypothetical protein
VSGSSTGGGITVAGQHGIRTRFLQKKDGTGPAGAQGVISNSGKKKIETNVRAKPAEGGSTIYLQAKKVT